MDCINDSNKLPYFPQDNHLKIRKSLESLMKISKESVKFENCNASKLLEKYETPFYLYEESSIREQYRKLKNCFSGVDVQLHYAMKANHNPAILKVLLEEGSSIDAVSPLEARLALEVGFQPEQILFTGNNIGIEELAYCHSLQIVLNIESLSTLEIWGHHFPDTEVSLRFNPGIGEGHHAHCITGGPQSKFGIYFDQIEQVKTILQRYHLRLTGIHSHIGTGIVQADAMLQAMEMTLEVAQQFEGLEFIDFGGGFGIPYSPDSQSLDLPRLGEKMSTRFQKFREDYGKPLQMKLEPGRFLVAQAGFLVVQVTAVKETPMYSFVGVNSGFNHLIRPMAYGSYHRIENISAPYAPSKATVVVGNICETGDVFTQNSQGTEERMLPSTEIGQYLVICDAGAYGMAMSSEYNLRPRPLEVMVAGSEDWVIRKRDTYENLIQSFMF